MPGVMKAQGRVFCTSFHMRFLVITQILQPADARVACCDSHSHPRHAFRFLSGCGHAMATWRFNPRPNVVDRTYPPITCIDDRLREEMGHV